MVYRFVQSTQYVRTDIKIITEDYRQRRLKESTAKILHDADTAEEMIAMLQDELDHLQRVDSSTETLEDQTNTWLEGLTEALDAGGTTGYRTGFSQYDMMTGGLKKNHFVVIGGRPKMGKTAYALNKLHRLASQGVKCALYSYEMGFEEIHTRLAGIDSNLRGLNFMDEEKLSKAVQAKTKIDKLPIHIIDNISSDYRVLLNHCRRMIRKEGVEVIFIDYLQLLRGSDKSNRNNEIGEITRALKQFNMQYRVPIILLSQLNRGVEHAEKPRRPVMSDLRDSGSIEQDANVVVLLYRENDDTDILEVIVAGNRAGATGFFNARFDKPASRIDAISHEYE